MRKPPQPGPFTAAWVTFGLLLSAITLVLFLDSTHAASPRTLGLWILGIGAGPTTLFAVLYGWTVRWWEFWIGRALLVSSTGMAAACDLALLNRVFPDGWPLQEQITLIVLVLIAGGGVLKLAAFLRDKIPLWLGHRVRRDHRAHDSNETDHRDDDDLVAG